MTDDDSSSYTTDDFDGWMDFDSDGDSSTFQFEMDSDDTSQSSQVISISGDDTASLYSDSESDIAESSSDETVETIASHSVQHTAASLPQDATSSVSEDTSRTRAVAGATVSDARSEASVPVQGACHIAPASLDSSLDTFRSPKKRKLVEPTTSEELAIGVDTRDTNEEGEVRDTWSFLKCIFFELDSKFVNCTLLFIHCALLTLCFI